MKYGIILLFFSSQAMAIGLDGYLDQVTQKHRGLESLRKGLISVEQAQIAGDIDLVPTLTVDGSYLVDKSQPNQLAGNESVARVYDMSLSKKFSTGTQVKLFGSTGEYDTYGSSFTNFPGFSDLLHYSKSSVGISISQSLWKDFLGHATWLKDQRLAATEKMNYSQGDLQARQILNGVEANYWEYLYSLQEKKIREDSLERAIKIENWYRRRVSDGISDKADLLTAEGSTAKARLALLMADDGLVALQKKMHDDLEIAQNQPLPKIEGDLSGRRDLRKFVGGPGKVVALDSWLASLNSKVSEFTAEEAAENVKADLNLSGSYASNGYQPGGFVDNSGTGLGNGNMPTEKVALTWTYLFDDSIKTATKATASAAAEAAKLSADRKSEEGETAWSELNREYDVLNKKIDAATILSRIQSERAKAEQDKLARGRAVTTDVVLAQEDEASAALQLSRFQADQRKLESQARLYIVVKDNE